MVFFFFRASLFLLEKKKGYVISIKICKPSSGKDTMLLPIQCPLLNQVLGSLGGPAQRTGRLAHSPGSYFKEIVSRSSSRQVKLWESLSGAGGSL